MPSIAFPGSLYRADFAANKADNSRRRLDAVEFYALGLGEPHPVSALHGTGTGDLLDCVVESFRILEAAARSAGLPEGALQCLETVSIAGTEAIPPIQLISHGGSLRWHYRHR